MVKEKIESAIEIVKTISKSEITVKPSEGDCQEIPTLQKDFKRKTSPMLRERFLLLGSWYRATHADWLSCTEMNTLTDDQIEDARLRSIKKNLFATIDNWENDAAALFKPERVSVFAADDIGFERIYLVWFDCIDEPELWVYDSNGESRYKNLSDYLDAYIDDDISAMNRKWKLADN